MKNFTSTIEELESRYRRDVFVLQNDFINFKDILKEKDMIISTQIQLLSEIGLLFSEFSISASESKKKPSQPIDNSSEILALLNEVKNQQSQIQYLKDICEIYQSDTEKANKKAEFIEQEFARMKQIYEEKIAEMQKAQQSRENFFEEEKAKLIKE